MKNYLESLIPPGDYDVYSWAEENYYLSPESSAYPGKFHAYPYQKEILKCMTPGLEKANGKSIWRLTLLKSSRIGYNKMLMACVGFHIHRRPSTILIVEPTEDDCKELSKEEIGPLIRDTPILNGLISDQPKSDGTAKLLHKMFPGGLLSLGSAKTPNSFRRISRKIVITDEIDAYPLSSGKEGSPSELAIRRSQDYYDRMCIEGSTPCGNSKESVIYNNFLLSDQRKYNVECPKCGYKQILKWERLWWKEDDYSSVVYRCSKCDHGIEYKYQKDMVENGEWIAENLLGEPGHVGFYINSLYSRSPNVNWSILASEYDRAKLDENKLTVFYNTVLGLPLDENNNVSIDVGDILSHLDNSYSLGEVPKDCLLLTSGIDVQGDRVEISIWGFGDDEKMWFIDHFVIEGDILSSSIWEQVNSVVNHKYGEKKLQIKLAGIDSGYASEQVANICARNRLYRPLKGSPTIDAAIIRKQSASRPSANKAKIFKRDQLYIVGTHRIKTIIHKKLVKMITDQDNTKIFLPGDTEPTFAEQLTAENYVREGKMYKWTNTSGLRNEALDCCVYAYSMFILFSRKYNSNTMWDQLKKTRNNEQIIDDDNKQIKQQPTRFSNGFNRISRPF